MTTTDHHDKTTPKTAQTEEPTADVDGRDHRLVNAGNIATAVAALGLSIACGALLPLPVYKALVGLAFVIAVVGSGVLVHRRFFKADEPAIQETTDGR